MAAREESIFVRASGAEKDAFKRGAEADDLSLSDWLRKLAKKRLIELQIEIKSSGKKRA